uniref:Myeloid leukemia factor 2 n=1 Tax=Sinocyclocheilus grahami TaxID=75366 RepID=A0A672JST9_SINGR
MFRYLNDVDDSPYMMDPFAAQRHQMRGLFGSFGMDPFPFTPQIQHPRTRLVFKLGSVIFSNVLKEFSSAQQGCVYLYIKKIQCTSRRGGIRETRQTMRDSTSGLERMAIGHHIGERGHVMERSRNRLTGDREERQDFFNLEESEAASFDEEWRREVGRYRPHNARSLDYGRERSAGVGQQLALTAPPSSSSSPSPRHESPRHHPPHSRPRYDW